MQNGQAKCFSQRARVGDEGKLKRILVLTSYKNRDSPLYTAPRGPLNEVHDLAGETLAV